MHNFSSNILGIFFLTIDINKRTQIVVRNVKVSESKSNFC